MVIFVFNKPSIQVIELFKRRIMGNSPFNQEFILNNLQLTKKFYTNLGFKHTGKSYLEDGIPHIEMISNLKR